MKTQTERRMMARSMHRTDETHEDAPVYIVDDEHRPKLITFGRGATTVDYGHIRPNETMKQEGYETPESFFAPSRWHTHDHAERRNPDDYEGVPYLDVRAAAETAAGIKQAISGPMVDVDATEPRPFAPSPTSRMMMAAMAGNAYGALLATAETQAAAGETYGALDYVPIPTHLALWRAAGATTGTIRSGRFVPDCPACGKPRSRLDADPCACIEIDEGPTQCACGAIYYRSETLPACPACRMRSEES